MGPLVHEQLEAQLSVVAAHYKTAIGALGVCERCAQFSPMPQKPNSLLKQADSTFAIMVSLQWLRNLRFDCARVVENGDDPALEAQSCVTMEPKHLPTLKN
eukprot:3286236-Amphidinium_carterae.1